MKFFIESGDDSFKSMTTEQFIEWVHTNQKEYERQRRVGFTDIGSTVVSTVFSFCNMSGSIADLYETAVFVDGKSVYTDRHMTRSKAELEHHKLVTVLKYYAEGYYGIEDVLDRYPNLEVGD